MHCFDSVLRTFSLYFPHQRVTPRQAGGHHSPDLTVGPEERSETYVLPRYLVIHIINYNTIEIQQRVPYQKRAKSCYCFMCKVRFIALAMHLKLRFT